jgi:hypothetical protein
MTPALTADDAAYGASVGCHAWLMRPSAAADVVQAVRHVLASDNNAPASRHEALLDPIACPGCASADVRAAIRVGSVQYYCCQSCRLCWRVHRDASVV